MTSPRGAGSLSPPPNQSGRSKRPDRVTPRTKAPAPMTARSITSLPKRSPPRRAPAESLRSSMAVHVLPPCRLRETPKTGAVIGPRNRKYSPQEREGTAHGRGEDHPGFRPTGPEWPAPAGAGVGGHGRHAGARRGVRRRGHRPPGPRRPRRPRAAGGGLAGFASNGEADP